MSRVPANGSAKSMSECQVSMNMDQSSVLFTEPSKKHDRVSLSMHVAKKKKRKETMARVLCV